VPALVAAARGAQVTALDWAADAVALLRANAARNGVELEVVHADWRGFSGSFDLALGADLLYERRNGEALLALLPQLAPEVLLAEPGRPYAGEFLLRARAAWEVSELGERVYRLTRDTATG
jgi:predicted nicotinamide N-methyase